MLRTKPWAFLEHLRKIFNKLQSAGMTSNLSVKINQITFPGLYLDHTWTRIRCSTFEWNAADTETFNKIKRLFLEAQTLTRLDPQKEYFLLTDASDKAIGGHLYQLRDDGRKPESFSYQGYYNQEKFVLQ